MLSTLLLLALTTPPPADSVEVREILEHVGANVITATYADLDREAAALAEAIDALAEAPSEPALADARTHWRRTRQVWEQAEAFIFGPVTFAGLDADLDTWPLNLVDLEGLLASDLAIEPGLLADLDLAAQGFHAIEYLLWSETGDKAATHFTPREVAYLRLITGALVADIGALHAAWQGPEGYAAVLGASGDPASAYATPRDGLYELLMGILFIVDEVAAEKLQVPLTSGTGRFAESRFSRSSREDIADNLRGVLHVYTGTYGDRSGPSLSDLVVALDPALDARFRTQVDAALAATLAIPGSLEAAIEERPATVEAAQQAVERVQRTLENDLVYLLVPPDAG